MANHSSILTWEIPWTEEPQSVQFSVVQSCPTLCKPLDCSTPGLSIIISQSLLKLMPIESVTPSKHLILCRPFLSCLQSLPASGSFPRSQFFASGGQSIGCFSFSISPSNEYSTDFLQDGLVGSPCSPRDPQESSPTPQFKSINSQALSFLYSPTLNNPYMATGQTTVLTRQTFIDKVMSLLFNLLSLSQFFFQGASVF